MHFKLVPIFFFWNLCVEDGQILSDKFAFLLSDFLCNSILLPFLGIIHYIKCNGVCLCGKGVQDSVFRLCACLYSNVMLCNPLQHIVAFTDIDNLIVKLDAVNPCVIVFWCITVFP